MARSESYERTARSPSRPCRELWLDLLVIGVDGLDAATGATCRPRGRGRHERRDGRPGQARGRGHPPVDKIGGTTFARICETGAIDTLVTDATAPPDELGALRDAGVKVTVVGGDR